MELKKRCDMDPRFMWKLEDIFPDKAAWEKECAEAERETAEIEKLSGSLAGGVAEAKRTLDEIHRVMLKVMRCSYYAGLMQAGDNGDAEYQTMSDRGNRMETKFGAATAFMQPELLALPEEKLSELMNAPELSDYRFTLADIARKRAHTLDANSEKLLAMQLETASTPENCYSMLSEVDMVFPDVVDKDGEHHTLTHGNYGVYRESQDRVLRKSAAENMFGEYKKSINTFAAMYAGQVKQDRYFADVRGYEDSLAMSLNANNVPREVYTSLIEAAHASGDAMRAYIDMRREVMGISEVHMYDMYAPLVGDIDMSIEFEDAKTLVKKALAPLGAHYAGLLDEAFTNGWIDVYENKGKTTGAFSAGMYGVHPYVLLNYSNKLDDAFTLAHELGHAMHSWHSNERQPLPDSQYATMVAEVASTVNEVLLTKYLLATETDPSRRAFILNHFLESFRTTLFRQTLFAEFELESHLMSKRGETLTAEALSALYKRLTEEYYPGAVVDDTFADEWACIPHFYMNFYVFQYATGFSSAIAIADSILKTGDASGYLEFLSMGSSKYPIDELKAAGIDLTRPDTVKQALSVFAGAVDEMKQAMKEVK